jgi:hypothetical protein
MSSMATQFVTQIRQNLESWRTREIDYPTFTELQRDTWAAIQAAGREVAADVLRMLVGSVGVADVLLLADDHHRTTQVTTRSGKAAASPRRYGGVLARTAAGSPVLRVSVPDRRNARKEHRQIAAVIYEIAADLERRSHELEVHWSIAADAERGEVVIELSDDRESALADELVADVMARHQLI